MPTADGGPGILTGEKLAAYNAQFQRSNLSPLNEASSQRQTLDGAVILDKYMRGGDAANMSGAEFYAMVGHIKRQQGAKGDALEAELMKIGRQRDKKLRLMDWVGQHYGAPAAPPPAAQAAPPSPMASHGQPPAPAAGTPSKTMPPLNLATSLQGAFEQSAEAPVPNLPRRPDTARAALGGSQMEGLLNMEPSAPMTARPSTAAAATEPADMSVCMQSYRMGRDHLKMSGGEYYALVGWLKSRGHSDIEDLLLKVRTLGDKKLSLVKYMREKCGDLAPGDAGMGMGMGMGGAPPPQAAHMPPPTQMGEAQVLQMPQQPVERDLGAPPPSAMPNSTMEVMRATNVQQQAVMAAVSAIQQAGPMAGGAVSSSLTSLEQTLARLEESFNFAVECMQTDMQECKKSLAELKMQLGA